MKRLLLLICLSASLLSAYDLSMDSRNSYMIFDPDERMPFLTYPSSWLKPSTQLFEHHYTDSSYSFAKWDQIFNLGNISNIITAKYTPYSLPQRWSASLEFTNYKAGNSTKRIDAVLNYKHKNGEIEYYHTGNLQTLILKDATTTQHDIRSHGLTFTYDPALLFRFSGGMDINFIKQTLNVNTANSETKIYDIHHEFLELSYIASKKFNVYSTFHYRYYVNDTQLSSLALFYPGAIYKGDRYTANFSLRISPTEIKPIFSIGYHIDPIFFELYCKLRDPILILDEAGRQYLGFKAGLNYNNDNFSIKALYYSSQDIPSDRSLSLIENKLSHFEAEYLLNASKAQFYLNAQSNDMDNPTAGYYHPERSIIEVGTKFNMYLAKGNLILHTNINAQYITHDDPDNVAFDPSTLNYTLIKESDVVHDWKANLSIKAIIKTMSISLNISTPIDPFADLTYHLEEGIYLSNDLYYGNNFYAGLTIEWLWWK